MSIGSDEYFEALKGLQITQLTIDYALTIRCEDEMIKIEVDFNFIKDEIIQRIDLSSPESLTPILSLLHGTISTVDFNDSALSIHIRQTNGDIAKIIIEPDDNYEAWNIHIKGWYIICLPGGEFSIFSPPNI